MILYEIIEKMSDWFGGACGFRQLDAGRRQKLINLPLCNSPEEYKETADKLRFEETPCEK